MDWPLSMKKEKKIRQKGTATLHVRACPALRYSIALTSDQGLGRKSPHNDFNWLLCQCSCHSFMLNQPH